MKIVNAGKVIVRNKSGKYLLLRSGEWPERPDRSLGPDLPGGELNKDETFEQGAVRELFEETGIVVDGSELRPIFLDSHINVVNISVNRVIFLVNVPDQIDVKLSWEHIEYQWVSGKDLINRKWNSGYEVMFEYLIEIGVIEID